MSKFENFPELKEGDLIVCGKRNGFLMTGRGAYALSMALEAGSEMVKITGNTSNPINILELNTEFSNSFYIPQAVFRPPACELIDCCDLIAMLTDHKNYITSGGSCTCVWSQDTDETKELTVDEVSELLGYKVKIIGENKNAGV